VKGTGPRTCAGVTGENIGEGWIRARFALSEKHPLPHYIIDTPPVLLPHRKTPHE